MPETNEVEPLSDERLDMLEDDFRAGRGCFSGWGLALVAEVRGLRKALLKRGDHTYMCMAKFNDGPCSCGWEAERAALAGEPHEQREGGGP